MADIGQLHLINLFSFSVCGNLHYVNNMLSSAIATDAASHFPLHYCPCRSCYCSDNNYFLPTHVNTVISCGGCVQIST